MALTIDKISSLILEGQHLFASKLNQEFTDSQYNSNIDSKGFNFTLSSDLYYLIKALEISRDKNLIDFPTVNLYLELERRLGTYLDNTSLDPNYLPPAGTIILPGDSFKTFLSLLDTPDSYTTAANFLVAVDPSQDGLIFVDPGTLFSANNGLNTTSGPVQLGGTLIKDTSINLGIHTLILTGISGSTSLASYLSATGFSQQIINSTNNTLYSADPTDINLSGVSLSTNNEGVLGVSNTQVQIYYKDGNTNNELGFLIDGTSAVFHDELNSTGLVYANDYSLLGKLNPRWIPDWGAIQNGFENGIHITLDGNIGLGGNLNESTVINGSGTYTLTLESLNSGTYGGTLTVNNGNVISTSHQNLGGSGIWLSTIDNNANTITLSTVKSGGGTKSIVINGSTSNVALSMLVTDTVLSAGLSYSGDYHTANNSNPRWIPDKGYVDNAITGATPATIYFGTGSLLGLGTIVSPYYPNAGNGLSNSDPVYGITLGGNLIKNTTINNSTFDFILNQSTGGSFIARYKFNGTDEAYVTTDGYFRGSGTYALGGLSNGFLTFSSTGNAIGRNLADNSTALKIQQSNTGSTGDILEVQNYANSVFTIAQDSGILYFPNKAAIIGSGIAFNMGGYLKPTANSDTLVGMKIAPVFGASTIATTSTLIGGTGYPNGVSIASTSGGTGIGAVFQITVSGGIITSVSLVNGGVNYTPTDVLNLLSQVSGTGGTITVATITSYSGLTNHSLEILNGPSKFAPSTSSYQSIIVPTGSSYGGSTDGSVWNDGTHLYAYIAGAARQLDQQGSSITLTTTGTSGAATLIGSTLNIPVYAGTTYSAGTGLTLTSTTFSVNTSQNISTLSNLTSNGLVQTTGGIGALSVVTTTLPTGIVTSSLTTVGTIGTGTWQGTAIGDTYISSSTNWNTAYTNRITSLTTTGSSGAATLSSNTLNIPNYTLVGLGGVATTVTVAGFALSSNVTLATLTATDSTLTFSGSYNGATTRTVGINLGTANIWTGLITAQSGIATSGNITGASQGTSGVNINTTAATYSDNSSSAGTVAAAVANTFGIPTFTTPTNAVTYTEAATLRISGAPVAGTHVTIGNAYSLWVKAGATRIEGGISLPTGSQIASNDNIATTAQVSGNVVYATGNSGAGGVALNGGTHYGLIQVTSTSPEVWQLGYGSSPTSLGTAVLKWANTGIVNVPGLTASKLVFTDSSKNLTSTGIGTSSQYILGDGTLGTIGAKSHTIFTPSTGGTVNLVNNQYNIINPAGTLATLTVNLPSSPSNNDTVYIKYTQAITATTYGNGTVVDGITAPTAGGLVVLVYDSGTTSWY